LAQPPGVRKRRAIITDVCGNPARIVRCKIGICLLHMNRTKHDGPVLQA